MAFRQQYYLHLQRHCDGFKPEMNLSSTLDAVLKNDIIDLDSLRKLCLKSSVPPLYRPKVWRVLLGVYSKYPETWEYVQDQNRQQYEDLQRSADILFKSFGTVSQNEEEEPNFGPESQEYSSKVAKVVRLYNVDCYLDVASAISSVREKKNIPDIAKVFCSVFNENPVDAYFCHRKMVNQRFLGAFGDDMNNVAQRPAEAEIIEKLIQKLHVIVRNKLPGLLSHLKSLNIRLHQFCYSWFCNYFASCLPTHNLKKVWDRIVSVGDSILPSYAYSILLATSEMLMSCTRTASAHDILMTIPENVTSKLDRIHAVALEHYESSEDYILLQSPKLSRSVQ